MTSSTKTLKLAIFTGAQDDFQLWYMRFEAYASSQEFYGALVDGGETLPATDVEVMDITKDMEKALIEARTRNRQAIWAFNMA